MVASGAVGVIGYENIGGKGGTIGLAKYVEKYDADPDTLLISGMVMVGAVALQKPAVTIAQVAPVARLTSDYEVVAVKADSPIKTPKDLIAQLRADAARTVIAGGSAGGVDHMYAGMLARVAGNTASLVYQPHPGGAQVVEALETGKAVPPASRATANSATTWPAASCAPSACRRSARSRAFLGARTGRGRRPRQLARRAHRQEGAAVERRAVLLEAVRRATAHDAVAEDHQAQQLGRVLDGGQGLRELPGPGHGHGRPADLPAQAEGLTQRLAPVLFRRTAPAFRAAPSA
jgi:putative tricarboxylic transport membrane protein